MPKKRIKHRKCLNCGHLFNEEVNYCPNCGQENDDKIKSIWLFIKDFFLDVVSLDTRLYRSVLPFLFRPGRLSKSYIVGKRRYFISPIRLYLTVSVIYFFILNAQLKRNVSSDFLEEGLSIRKATLQLPPDTLSDSLRAHYVPRFKKGYSKTNVNFFGEEIPIHEVIRLSEYEDISVNAIIDSVNITNGFFNRMVVTQTQRISTATPREIFNNFMGTLPILMFFLLPVFALLLKFLYFRTYYVAHLVFALHLHCFIYLILGIFLILSGYDFFGSSGWVVFLSLIIMFLYTYKSFRNVYLQGRFLTLFKLFVLMITYSIVFTMGLVFDFIISFLVF